MPKECVPACLHSGSRDGSAATLRINHLHVVVERLHFGAVEFGTIGDHLAQSPAAGRRRAVVEDMGCLLGWAAGCRAVAGVQSCRCWRAPCAHAKATWCRAPHDAQGARVPHSTTCDMSASSWGSQLSRSLRASRRHGGRQATLEQVASTMQGLGSAHAGDGLGERDATHHSTKTSCPAGVGSVVQSTMLCGASYAGGSAAGEGAAASAARVSVMSPGRVPVPRRLMRPRPGLPPPRCVLGSGSPCDCSATSGAAPTSAASPSAWRQHVRGCRSLAGVSAVPGVPCRASLTGEQFTPAVLAASSRERDDAPPRSCSRPKQPAGATAQPKAAVVGA